METGGAVDAPHEKRQVAGSRPFENSLGRQSVVGGEKVCAATQGSADRKEIGQCRSRVGDRNTDQETHSDFGMGLLDRSYRRVQERGDDDVIGRDQTEHRREDLVLVACLFDLDIHANAPATPTGRVAEGDDRWQASRSLDLVDLRGRQLGQGRAMEVGAMMEHEHAVSGSPDVELHHVCTHVDGMVEGST